MTTGVRHRICKPLHPPFHLARPWHQRCGLCGELRRPQDLRGLHPSHWPNSTWRGHRHGSDVFSCRCLQAWHDPMLCFNLQASLISFPDLFGFRVVFLVFDLLSVSSVVSLKGPEKKMNKLNINPDKAEEWLERLARPWEMWGRNHPGSC